MANPSLIASDDLLICMACGTQYGVNGSSGKSECRICDDPRQYVPPSGQKFTTLRKLRDDPRGYKNVFEKNEQDEKVWEIWTEPKIGIGQRACLIQTPHGNVLWDLVAFLDEKTVEKIVELGGLNFIIISHPHFYTTWAEWSSTFKCPVYIAEVDSVWANRQDVSSATLKLLTEKSNELLPGLTAVVCGGHFPGSLVLHSSPPNTVLPTLFVADTIFATASGQNPDPGKPGVISYQFLWSIPNSIPLPPDTVFEIWQALKPYEFKVTYGVIAKVSNVYEKPGHRKTLKARILQSAQIAVKAMGYTDHPIFAEEL